MKRAQHCCGVEATKVIPGILPCSCYLLLQNTQYLSDKPIRLYQESTQIEEGNLNWPSKHSGVSEGPQQIHLVSQESKHRTDTQIFMQID